MPTIDNNPITTIVKRNPAKAAKQKANKENLINEVLQDFEDDPNGYRDYVKDLLIEVLTKRSQRELKCILGR